jgi:hypothetical protein
VYFCYNFEDFADHSRYEHCGAPSGSTDDYELKWQEHKIENAHGFVLFGLIALAEVVLFL